MQTAELFLSDHQFDVFVKRLHELGLRPAAPLEEQAYPKHFDLIYKDMCIVHFDYVGGDLEFHVRALAHEGKIEMRPQGDFSLSLNELRKKIAYAVQSN